MALSAAALSQGKSLQTALWIHGQRHTVNHFSINFELGSRSVILASILFHTCQLQFHKVILLQIVLQLAITCLHFRFSSVIY